MSQHDLSVQLYTVRNALAEDFDGTLERIAGFGYTQVEPFQFVNFLDGLGALAKHGLTAPTAHVGLLAGDQDEIFGAAEQLGIGTVIEPAVREPQWQGADAIREVAAQLNAAAEKAAEHGLRVGYHNHWWELQSTVEGRHGLEVLADHLAPEVVLEVDTYWANAGGADVPALLGRLGDRVVALHVKDGDGSLDTKKQVAVGSGTLPVWDYIAAGPENALRVVELDDSAGDLLDAVRDSRTYLLAGQGA
ncbi:sugar phosphate isomerase/epimerase family protein [uncultured Friedmanniella sp.]|uniref:sugar phosphate isomerase/epimerase family protein n=1 Tax=uncultured Friedmanniella sp. TaxID=335381 RepID=UPI0035CB4E89